MTYKINGVTLTDPARGWKLLRGSTPVSALEYASSSFDVAGRDGSNTFQPIRRPVTFTFTVRTTSLDARVQLMALFGSQELLIQPEEAARQYLLATGHTLTSTVDEYHEALGITTDSFIVEIPLGCWRSNVVTTSVKTTAVQPSVTANYFPDISAPIQDAMVRIQGPIEKPQVQDSGGSFFVIDGTIPADNYVRFEMDTGRAWITNSDTWVGGTELTGEVDFGGPRGLFEITPNFTDPATRVAKLTLSQLSQNTGAGLMVRGRNAYLI